MNEKRTWVAGGLDGTALKMIALTVMLIDHVGAGILSYMGNYQGVLRFTGPLMTNDWGMGLYYVYRGCRVLGRLAFPIYCFLLTEGFIHTRDWRKYLQRMLIFALIAELPFDLALGNRWTWSAQNVFFELAAGIATLRGLKAAEGYYDFRRCVYMALAVGAGCVFAWAIRADYGYYGILLMAVYYLLRERKLPRLLAGGVMGFLQSLYMTWGAAALAFVPLYFYNGRQGKRGMGRLFYWFYPVHLLLILGFRWFVLGIPIQAG